MYLPVWLLKMMALVPCPCKQSILIFFLLSPKIFSYIFFLLSFFRLWSFASRFRLSSEELSCCWFVLGILKIDATISGCFNIGGRRSRSAELGKLGFLPRCRLSGAMGRSTCPVSGVRTGGSQLWTAF